MSDNGYRVVLTKTSNSGRTLMRATSEKLCAKAKTLGHGKENCSPGGAMVPRYYGEETRELFMNPYLAESPAGARCCVAPKACNLFSRVSNWAGILRNFHCGQRSCPKSMWRYPSHMRPSEGGSAPRPFSLSHQALVSSEASHIKRPRCPQSPVSSLLSQPNTALRLNS